MREKGVLLEKCLVKAILYSLYSISFIRKAESGKTVRKVYNPTRLHASNTHLRMFAHARILDIIFTCVCVSVRKFLCKMCVVLAKLKTLFYLFAVVIEYGGIYYYKLLDSTNHVLSNLNRSSCLGMHIYIFWSMYPLKSHFYAQNKHNLKKKIRSHKSHPFLL